MSNSVKATGRPWVLHRQPTAFQDVHEYSIFEDNEVVLPLNAPVGHEDKLDRMVKAVNSYPDLVRALEEIAKHPGPNSDEGCWHRVEIARAALALHESKND